MFRFRDRTPSSDTLKFKEDPSGFAPTPVSNFMKSTESTVVVEHPRARFARDIESHERVGHLFRHWLSLVVGISLGVALVIAFQVSTNLKQIEAPVEGPAAIQVTALDSQPVESIMDAAAVQVEDHSIVDAQHSEVEPSHIVEHALSRPVKLSERKFVYTSGAAMRSYDSGFLSSDANGQFDFKLGESAQALSLKPVNDSSGRYQLGSTNIQWQGDWQANNPEHNIKLGTAYLDYVDHTFGNAVGSNLSTVNQHPSSLLGRMPRKNSAPTGLKSYSAGNR